MIEAQAAFLKNTVDPMLDKFQDLLWFAETKGFKYGDIRNGLRKALFAQLLIEFIRAVTQITCLALVCYTVWRIV